MKVSAFYNGSIYLHTFYQNNYFITKFVCAVLMEKPQAAIVV